MKKILFFLLGLLPSFLFGQSTTITPAGLQNYTIKTPVGAKGFDHSFQTFSMGTYLSADAGWFQSHSSHQLLVGYEFNYSIILNLNGNVQFRDYVKLGSDAPQISERTFTGVTNSIDGAQYVVATNVPQDKVLSANLVVNLGPAGFVPQSYKYTTGYQVELRIEDNFVIVCNAPGNSSNILNKPFSLNIFIKK
jgi:hypothetical protein